MRTVHRNIVGIFLFSNDEYCLLGKSRSGGVYNDEWMVIGGGIEAHETKLEALKRETLEEVGIDITGFKIQLLDKVFHGQSQKILRDTDEQVLVKMTFYDFVVYANKPAKDIAIICEDDIAEAKWHPLKDLPLLNLAAPTKVVLHDLGYL
jgi:8-oxo-dGTP pyrophosphatase MutT (NUDIX family)